MNIGLFTDTYFPQINGVGTSVHTLCQELTRKGHHVYIFTPTDPNQPEDEDENIIRMPSMPFIFVKQFRMGLLYSPLALKKIARLNLDIVHTQTEFSLGMFGKILSKTLHIPMVHTYHTMYEDYVHYIINGHLITPEMARDFSRIFCNSTNAVIAPTEKVKHLLYSYGVTKPVSIIPTGINIEKFRKINYKPEDTLYLRRELGIGEHVPVILSLGRVAKEKSIDMILRAMPLLLERVPDAKLVIVGDGPVRGDLEELAQSLHLQSSVLFTGARPWDEIGRYYQLGDVFVSASITETQGLTFIEAMAAGLVVVARRDESIEGVVRENETGFLFEDEEGLAQKLTDILKNPRKKDAIVQNTLSFVDSVSSETFGANVESLYEDMYANPEKYDIQPHHISPIIIGKKAVRKMEEINSELSEDIRKKSETLINMSKLPAKKVIRHYKKLTNREKSDV